MGNVAAALIIRFNGWLSADPIASLIVTVLVMRSAWMLVRERWCASGIDARPHLTWSGSGANGKIRESSPSDLHVWRGYVQRRCHERACHSSSSPERPSTFWSTSRRMRLFGIQHVTIQLERSETVTARDASTPVGGNRICSLRLPTTKYPLPITDYLLPTTDSDPGAVKPLL